MTRSTAFIILAMAASSALPFLVGGTGGAASTGSNIIATDNDIDAERRIGAAAGTSTSQQRWRRTQSNIQDVPTGVTPAFLPFQFGHAPTSDDHAGGMYYDPSTHSITATGNVRLISFGESDCFVSRVNLATWADTVDPSNINRSDNIAKEAKLASNVLYRTGKSEACTAIAPAGPAGGDAMVVGYTEDGGLMTHLNPTTGYREERTVYGFAASVDTTISTAESAASHNPLGILFPDFDVQYPVGAASFGNGDVVVAMIVSTDGDSVMPINPDEYDINDFPVYGERFRIWMTRISRKQDGNYEKVWSEFYGTNDEQAAFVTDVKVVYDPEAEGREIVVMAGTTAGHGAAFGAGKKSTSESDLDGFVTKLDGKTGKILGYDPTAPADESNYHTATYSARISSLPGKTETIGGVCVSVNKRDPNGAIYVVGSSTSLMQQNFVKPGGDDSDALTPFVQKLELDTMNVVWTRQLGSAVEEEVDGQVFDVSVDGTGLGCSVTSDGDVVYVGGVVTDGGRVAKDQTSAGGDDVFLALLDAKTGSINHLQQTGTNARDALAKHNPVLTDKYGHAVLLGTTEGSLVPGEVSGKSDVFVLQFWNPVARPMDGSYGYQGARTQSGGGESGGGLSFLAKTGISVFIALILITGFVAAYLLRVRHVEKRALEEMRAAEPTMIDHHHQPHPSAYRASVEPQFGRHHNPHHHDEDEYSFDMASITEGMDNAGGSTAVMQSRVSATLGTTAAFGIDEELSEATRSNYEDLVNSYSNYVIDPEEEEDTVDAGAGGGAVTTYDHDSDDEERHQVV